VAGEMAINKYEIEKSADGIHFSKISTQTPIGNDGRNYNYLYYDASPFNGFNFYRIHSVGNSGDEKFTSIVKVWYENQKPTFLISPNPVTGNKVIITFNNQAAGVYELQLFDDLGQLIISKSINHSGVPVSTYSLEPQMILAAGVYMINIKTPNNNHYTEKISIN
jgi:hypothetical protein